MQKLNVSTHINMVSFNYFNLKEGLFCASV